MVFPATETEMKTGIETGMEFQLLDLFDLLEQVQKLHRYLPQAKPKELRVPVSDPENATG